jgi:hypothetical protein
MAIRIKFETEDSLKFEVAAKGLKLEVAAQAAVGGWI